MGSPADSPMTKSDDALDQILLIFINWKRNALVRHDKIDTLKTKDKPKRPNTYVNL